ncbi:MAG: site-specific integrase, partial [Candidatus Methylomirabilis oxyfera]|nr:site-specific integrase [Candidatus Methylomirabilis oxyfera]
MDNLVEEYLRYLTVERGLAENSLAAYGRDLRRIVGYFKQAGVGSFQEVGRGHVARLLLALREEGLAPRTVARRTSSLRGLYRYL